MRGRFVSWNSAVQAAVEISAAGIAWMVFAGASGCTTPEKSDTSSAPSLRPDISAAKESGTKSSSSSIARVPSDARGPAIELPAFEVQESAFTDFGMSVRTNAEVKWGGELEWMQVSAVAPASSADNRNLAPGDRILAIDRRLIKTIGRDAMVAALFQRSTGDRLDLLVLGRGQALPHFVVLTAGRLGVSK